MNLQEKRAVLIERLNLISNPQERFAYVVESSRRFPKLDPEFKTENYRVQGCLSNLWFVPEFREGKCFFKCDADSLVVRSIAALLCDFYSGGAPEEILALDPAFLSEVGITQHLSLNRRSGLSHLWEKIARFAAAHLPVAPPASSTTAGV